MDVKENEDRFALNEDLINEDEQDFLREFTSQSLEEEQAPVAKEEEEEEEEEEITKTLFGSDEEEEEEEELDFDLEMLNKKFNTNFKTSEEFKNFLENKKDETENEIEKEEKELNTYQSNIEYFSEMRMLDHESLIRENLKNLAVGNGKDLNDQDVLDEIDEEIEDMKEARTLAVNAQSLRQMIDQKIDGFKEKKSSIETKREQRKAQEQKQKDKKLQEAYADIFSEEHFFGIKPEPEEIKSAYEKSRNSEFLTSLESDTKLKAKVALFLELEDKISKRANAPDFNDGISSVMEEILPEKSARGKSIRSSQSAGSSKSKSGEAALITGLLGNKPKANDK